MEATWVLPFTFLRLWVTALQSADATSAGAVSAASVDADRTELRSLGLWVCDSTVRHLLETLPSSVASGEIFGRCTTTYSKAACESMHRAVYNGESVVGNLQYICGPPLDRATQNNAFIVGSGAYKPRSMTGTGFGPLGKSVKVPGANGEMRTSFRGPISPPMSNEQIRELDSTVKGKRIGKRYVWEKPSRTRSNAIDSAANAVRVYDAVGLGGGAVMESYAKLPVSARKRSTELAAPPNSTDISMNVSVKQSVSPDALPGGEKVQRTGNGVVQRPYKWAAYEGDWMSPDYFASDGMVPQSSASATSHGPSFVQEPTSDMGRADLATAAVSSAQQSSMPAKDVVNERLWARARAMAPQ